MVPPTHPLPRNHILTFHDGYGDSNESLPPLSASHQPPLCIVWGHTVWMCVCVCAYIFRWISDLRKKFVCICGGVGGVACVALSFHLAVSTKSLGFSTDLLLWLSASYFCISSSEIFEDIPKCFQSTPPQKKKTFAGHCIYFQNILSVRVPELNSTVRRTPKSSALQSTVKCLCWYTGERREHLHACPGTECFVSPWQSMCEYPCFSQRLFVSWGVYVCFIASEARWLWKLRHPF